ncbi:MAG: hypothetical protein KGD59_13190 [Candidatus Heimdallarchaeota archaeon]|nr:hypothetical protein [Candidatus Heimdallarchaeota archaeon]MBY8995502.1 hypothetical protein [Candidatus Heimdallarchaeota archaeon]
MINEILIYIGSAIIIVWGIAHEFATKSVVKGFGDISEDNKKIITLEWIAEGIALCFIGILAIFVTAFGDPTTLTNQLVYWISSGTMLGLGILTLLTGARTPIIPFKICPIVLTVVIILFMLGSLL